ncbi:hypothetical protein P9597_09490 [Aneurinibacillus migulanus]|uniref:hypothetical protein n=1 Tax=Aneurinibacillus migulanus TaxID=47500 RepID=UPI002E2105A9|nr:hypothetical protein [Aneurinibacillus migulanus]
MNSASYIQAYEVIFDYAHMVTSCELPTFSNHSSWYHQLGDLFNIVSADAIKWPDKIIPILVAAPQTIVDADQVVHENFLILLSDLPDLTNDQLLIDDANRQFTALSATITSLINQISQLNNQVNEFALSLREDYVCCQNGIRLASNVIANNNEQISNLQKDIGELLDQINQNTGLDSMIKQRIQEDQNDINQLSSENNVLSLIQNMFQNIGVQNQNSQPSIQIIRSFWVETSSLLYAIMDELQDAQNIMVSAPFISCIQVKEAYANWCSLVNTSKDLTRALNDVG